MPPSISDDEDESKHSSSSSSSIKIFLRVRPHLKKRRSEEEEEKFDVDPDAGSCKFDVPVDTVSDVVNNSRTSFRFKFEGVLGMDSTQEDVFETVARGPIDNALAGFNATIFAYGQTGSGKTYTITGGAERYADRGIIPRTLSYLFEAFRNRSAETQFTAYVSFGNLQRKGIRSSGSRPRVQGCREHDSSRSNVGRFER